MSTGNNPFIINGYTCSYKATGDRPDIPEMKDVKLDLQKVDHGMVYDYLIIMSEDEIKAHSLNMFAEW